MCEQYYIHLYTCQHIKLNIFGLHHSYNTIFIHTYAVYDFLKRIAFLDQIINVNAG